MNIEDSKLEILSEARKHGKQIWKLKSDHSQFVKVKRGYSEPEDTRLSYLSALSELVEKGLVSQVFNNADLELFELIDDQSLCATVRAAKAKILEELKVSRRVYKVHSERGEFVQFPSMSLNRNELERIMFMRALHELLYSGTIRVASESREMASFEMAPPQSGYVQCSRGENLS